MDTQDALQGSTTIGPNDGMNIRNFYKVQIACAELQACIKTIYECGLNIEELQKLANEASPVSQAIAESPSMLIANELLQKKETFNIEKMMETHKFNVELNPVDRFIYYPVISDPKLENLAFIHRSYPNMNVKLTEVEKTIMSNERLEFLGDSWLGAFVAHIIYKKYPYADEGALSMMKNAIVNNSNLAKLSEVLGFKERLKANIPTNKMKIKDKFSKNFADCVEAYIGALVVDRFGNDLKEVEDWVAFLAEDQFKELGPEMVKKPLNKGAKGELAELLQTNTLNEKLTYVKLNDASPFRVRAMLGPNILAYGEGHNIREAEQRAAMVVLENTPLLQKFCPFELEMNSSGPKYLIEETDDSSAEKRNISSSNDTDTATNKFVKINSNNSIPKSQEYVGTASTEPKIPVTNSNNLDIEEITNKVISLLGSKLTDIVSTVVTEAVKNDTSDNNAVQNSVVHRDTFTPVPKTATASSTTTDAAENATTPVTVTLRTPADVSTSATLPLPESTTASISKPAVQNSIPVVSIPVVSNPTDMNISSPPSPTSGSSNVSTTKYTPPALRNKNKSITLDTDKSVVPVDTLNDVPDAEDYYDKEAAQKLYALLGTIKDVPEYTVWQDEEGEPFNAVCLLKSDGQVIGEGSGRNKKLAKQICADNALRSTELQDIIKSRS
ncbi:hypothetical protein C6P45_001765 [Maudiozyma exigua]|uniref:RNase III domain-containing protein n=1 Tax=Maudiozyma exigua TaxID=34358 RepID=A0A9P7B5E9_MAUEX|nr:hypothetical protein C6P45_001765 [Kazachstania exigua]